MSVAISTHGSPRSTMSAYSSADRGARKLLSHARHASHTAGVAHAELSPLHTPHSSASHGSSTRDATSAKLAAASSPDSSTRSANGCVSSGSSASEASGGNNPSRRNENCWTAKTAMESTTAGKNAKSTTSSSLSDSTKRSELSASTSAIVATPSGSAKMPTQPIANCVSGWSRSSSQRAHGGTCCLSTRTGASPISTSDLPSPTPASTLTLISITT
mmetsp:Transcript_20928/g.51162  ORF Transcript_20928/g.51162 Transcript_20928/m.51162 type:complete len:217 (-) Transcript_20928:222-872(-)